MRKSVAPRGATPAWGFGRVGARCAAMSVIAVVLTFVMVWSQPAAALLPSSGESPALTSQATMPDADSVTWSGSLSPSITSSPPARLTGYHPRLLASTVTVPPVATSHPPQPYWIIVMSITGTSATPNVGLAGGSGGSHTIYLRYKEVGDTNWNATIFQADTRQSYSTVPIVMTGLSPNTNYEIQVSFDNSDWSPSEEERFITKSASATLPIVSAISVSNITACQANVRINFPNPSSDSVLVYYSWKTNTPGSTWGKINNYPSRGDGASINPAFSSETTYVIGATFDWNFVDDIIESAPFTTHAPPHLNGIGVDSIEETTATVRTSPATYCWSPGSAHFRYKPLGTETWITRSPGGLWLKLTGLTPLTEYVVEASMDDSFETGVVSTTFTTEASGPSVNRIEIPDADDEDITQTGATVIVYVDSPNGDPVHIRYSTDSNFQTGSTILTDSDTVNSPLTSAEFTLANLTSGTTYHVEASYDDTYPQDKTKSADFTTDAPTITGIAASDEEQTTATVTVTVKEPNDSDVHIRYSTDPNFGSSSTIHTDKRAVPLATGESTVEFRLTGLTSGTTYHVQSSYEDDPFPASDTTNTTNFTTKVPTVSAVSVKDITQTGATVTVSLPAPNGTTVYLHYKETTSGTWSSPEPAIVETGETSVEFTLTGLKSGTHYTVYGSYDSNPPQGSLEPNQTGTFETLPPSVTGVEVDDKTVTQDGARVTVTVQHPNGTFVHIRYSTNQNFTAGSTVLTDEAAVPAATDPSGLSTVNFDLTGLDAGTTYYVQASYDKDPFPATDQDNSANFTTKPPSPAVSSVEVLDSGSNEITKTSATARVHVTNPDGAAEVHIRYSTDSSFGQGSTIVTGSATPGTGDTYADFTFSSLTSGTTYYVQASYDNTFPATDATKTTHFITDPPALTDVTASDLTQTGATVTVTVDEPNDTSVRLHYMPAGGSWSTTDLNNAVFDANADTYTFDLTGLISGTEYTVYASYDSTPPSTEATLAAAQSDTFTTVDPNITDVEIDDQSITQTAATVSVTVDEPNSTPVQLHYKKTSESTWSGPMSATADPNTKKATFALDDLTSGTGYTVFASYDRTPPSAGATLADEQTDTFMTDPPTVEKVEATDKTDTTAEITVTIAEPNGAIQTVSVRYQTTPSGNWVTIQPDPTTDPTTDHATAVVNLGSLTANTQYKVEATLTGNFSQGVESTTFTTSSTGPGVSEVVMSDETQTGATATITIANAGTTTRTVYLQYRKSGSSTWSDPPSEGDSTTATPGTAVINLSGLASGTRYEVQASLDNNFASGVQSATFITKPPSASGVSVLEENPTEARVRVAVSEPNGKTTLFLRYGSGGDWKRDWAPNVSTEDVEFKLFGLEPDSTYQVEASFDSTFPQDATATGTVHTPHLDAPTVDVPGKGQTTATVSITVSSPDDQVFYRHRETPAGPWSSIRAAVVTGGSATATLSGLTSDTEHTVEASLSRSFPPNATGSFTFTTEPPGVDEVEVTDKTETTAEVAVTISAPNGESQTVYLEYDTSVNTDQGTWGNSEPGSSSDDEAIIDLSGLLSGVQYTVRASLTDDFSGETRTATFTTSSTSPHVSRVEVPDEDIEQTVATATISIANVTAATNVYLRYRTSPSGAWSDPILDGASTATDPGTATIEMTGLTSGTRYEVQASLDNNFASGVQSATFITKPPSASGVSVLEENPTEARVRVAVSEPNGKTTLFLRYGSGGDWKRDWAPNVSTEDVEFKLFGLEPDSTYQVEASFDSTFPQDATATGTVHTPHLDAPTVDVPGKGQTTATVSITVSSPDDQVFYRHRETPAGPWSSIRAAVVTGGSATATLSGLTSDTEHTVEASLSRSFPPNATGSFTFTTEPPGVDEVEVTDKTETTAEVAVTISAPNGESQTVYLEYDTSVNTDQGTWGNSEPGSSSDDEAIIDLNGLLSGVQYTVRASLTQDFSEGVRTATFTTASNDPGVSVVTITGESHTGATATITIANPGNVATDVHLRYQTTDPVGEWIVVQPSPSTTVADLDTAIGELTGLTSGTQYKVQASLDGTFATGVQTATFRTLSPVVSGVSVTGVTRSEATVMVGVTAPNGDPVFLQYRTGSNEWIGRFANVADDESSVEFGLSGLSSNSTYTVQASYDSTFITGVESANFTTQSAPRPRPTGGGGNTGGGNTGGGNTGGGNTGGGGNGGSKNQPPEFMEGTRTVRSVIENTPSGEDVGKPIPADDPDNDDLTYSLVGPDAGDFDVEDDSGQLLTRSPLDFETKTHFLVTVSVRDGVDSEGRGRHPARRPDPGRDPGDRRGRNAQPAARTHRDPANCAHGGGEHPVGCRGG